MAYDPRISYRGDYYLSQGMNTAFQSIAQAIASNQNKAREYKAMVELADATGIMPKEEAEKLGPDALLGHIRAYDYKRIQEEDKLRKQEFALRQQQVQAQLQQYDELMRVGQRMRQFGQDVAAFSQTPSVGGTLATALANPQSGSTLSELGRYMRANPVRQQLTPEAIMGMAGQAGVLTPDMAAALAKMSQTRPLNEFSVSELGRGRPAAEGYQFVPTSIHGGQLLPAPGAAGAGPGGEVPEGYQRVPDGKGGWRYLKEDTKVITARKKAKTDLVAKRKELAKHQAELDSGDTSVGLDWLNWGNRSTKIAGLKAEIAELERQHPELREQGPAAPAAAPTRFGNFNEGAIIKDKQGRLFRVVNGQPVPLG